MFGRNAKRFALLFGSIAILKALLFAIDSEPSFNFGDSASYLATATSKWIPPDRSFVYGFLLRPVVVPTHSLMPAVILQVVLSTFASCILGWCLWRYFNVDLRITVCATVLCAIEPLQLMSERLIMTESIATFGFALFIWCCLVFLDKKSVISLLLVQTFGAVLVSLRFSFLPLVLVLSIALPVLGRWTLGLRTNGTRWTSVARPLTLWLISSIALSQGLLYAYRHLYGYLAHQPAAYLSQDGVFLIADVAPLVRPSDFPIPEKRRDFFKKITIARENPDLRRIHRWLPGGISNAILQISNGNELEANRLARKTAIRAIRRDPYGFVKLGAITWSEFFDPEKLRWALRLYQGQFVNPTSNDLKTFRDWFGLDLQKRSFNSVIKRWEVISGPWCSFIVILPILYTAECVVRWRRVGTPDILCLICTWLGLSSAVLPVDVMLPRYLTPLPWLSILIAGVMVNRSLRSKVLIRRNLV